jgi:hypothetical protein
MLKKSSLPLPVIFLLCGVVFQAIAQPPIKQAYASISGVVSRDNGMLAVFTPIPGASVYLEMMSMLAYTNPNPAAGIPAPIYFISDSAVTDKNGNYRLDSVLANTGAYRLTFTAKGYQEKQILANIIKDTVINAPLTPITRFYALTGKVTVNCPMCGSLIAAPLPGCTVTIRIPFILPIGLVMPVTILPIRQISYSAVTDAQGMYRIDSLPADSGIDVSDSVWVYAYKTGFVPETLKTVLHVNAPDVRNFSLLRAATATQPSIAKNQDALPAMSYEEKTGTLFLSLDRSQNISLMAYRPDGRLIGSLLPDRVLSKGNYSYHVEKNRFGSGIVLIRATGTGLNKTMKISRP